MTVPSLLPRWVAPGIGWLGGCMAVEYGGEWIHGHMSAYLVVGEERTLLVDTGHPSHWPDVERHLEVLLDGRTLDYVFPTHPEYPHAGNAPRLLRAFPDAVLVGDVRDYHLYYPDLVPRLRAVEAGDRLELGGTAFVFLSALWRDLPNTLWGYDAARRVLFPADGFAFMHRHAANECALLAEELPAPPDIAQTVFINERALFWTRYVDPHDSFRRVDELLEAYPADLIAPAHGSVISDPVAMTPILKAGMDAQRVGAG